MRWLRSFPEVIPPHRAYVQDDMERLIIRDYDYSPLLEAASIDESVIVVEWDIALSASDQLLFQMRAQQHPDRVLVAPYLLYKPLPAHWAHRRVVWESRSAADCRPTGSRWIQTNETRCDLFGLGLVYLPRSVLTAWGEYQQYERKQGQHRSPPVPASEQQHRFTDDTFSLWHWSVYGTTPVCWDVCPVHLHY